MSTSPVAFYRVQLHAGFTFDDVASLTGYLAGLGVSHLYCSPVLKARPGSTHGYDVTDPTRLNPELGGAEGYRRMTAALQGAGIGVVVDFVPNHMAASAEHNPWWWDVLAHGRDSRYAGYFDIDWGPPEERMRGLIMLPILGDRYGVVLGSGDLRLVEHDGAPAVAYHEHRFPLTPGSLEGVTMQEANSDPSILHEVLERQHYRLAYWRSDRELNYRRFFDVNDLIALRMERDEVFEDAHRLAFELIGANSLDGLRIDHVDGLRDPKAYLDALHEHGAGSVWVEKVLGRDETLPEDWRTMGTTGYEFANAVLGVLLDPAAEESLTALYQGFSGVDDPYRAILRGAKTTAMRELLPSDLARLTEAFMRICDAEPGYRDFTRAEIRAALQALIAGLDVYRTYAQPARNLVSPADAGRIEGAAASAAERGEADPVLLRFLVDIMLLRHRSAGTDELVERLQQSSGPVMAKAAEDTAFYAYNRFIALNEVGGEPDAFGMTVEEFHRRNAWTQTFRPTGMLATSTHDTKRSEDVRARLAVLSEVPERWAEAVWRWAALNERHRRDGLPDRNAEYLLYQTLVGAWPITAERAVDYMRKASKEAKQHTSWIEPDPTYDDALECFVRDVLADDAFTTELEAFVAGIAPPGWTNSLAQTVLKLTCPGTPDIYRGCELWDLSLVDPDNRRPVDYRARSELLDRLRTGSASEALDHFEHGGPKLFSITRALALRRSRARAFSAEGSYVPLRAGGEAAAHVIAFVRGDEVVTVVPRLTAGLPDWGDTHLPLPAGAWRDVFTGATHGAGAPLKDLLGDFPVALLERAA